LVSHPGIGPIYESATLIAAEDHAQTPASGRGKQLEIGGLALSGRYFEQVIRPDVLRQRLASFLDMGMRPASNSSLG
jgi:hypothetical protein